MSFVETWMQLEMIILRNKKTNTIWCHLYVESKMQHTDEPKYKAEIDS